MAADSSFLLWLIVACEIGFWVLLALGLIARYLLSLPRLGAWLLLGVPLVDFILLAATTVDLARGATATFAHGLAAAYLGFTVAFGRLTIRWADRRMAYHFSGGPAPPPPPAERWAAVRHELTLWLRACAAAAITILLVALATAVVQEPSRTEALQLWLQLPLGTVALWFVFGPLWIAVFHRTRDEADAV